jgi:uncharacterized protein (UPF0335 family)
MTTNKSVIDKLVPIFTEIETLLEDTKEITTEAKEAGLDAAMLVKVAKAKASLKFADLHTKTEKLLNLLDEVE